MVEAAEIKAEPEVLLERHVVKSKHIFEEAIAIDRLPGTGDITAMPYGKPIHRIRKGVKIHVPSDYYAILYTVGSRGVSRIHGIFEYSEPESPHKIDELPELPTKGMIRKSYDLKIVYLKNDRENFGIRIPDSIYSSRDSKLSPVLTTDLLPIHYRVFRLEVQANDPNAFLTRIMSKRLLPSYDDIKQWALQELYWIISNELTKYDLLNAIKEKMTIQKEVHEQFAHRLEELALELLSIVWDYDIEDTVRDRYFWIHVQKIPSPEVLRMETLVHMSKELSKSPYTTGAGSQTLLADPLQKPSSTSER